MQTTKNKGIGLQKADAVADIELINRFSVRKLKPEDVYCFSIILCDNDIDRDNERFTNASLESLAILMTGKTGIFDHNWTATQQKARLYRVGVENTGQINSIGEPLKTLRGCAYILRCAENQSLINDIDGGIKKEVSIGCAISKCICSICGEPITAGTCPNHHNKGEKYGDRLCFGELEEPTDAYEFSFVAVPAQRAAGVTKNFESINKAFEVLLAADLSEYTANVEKLIKHLEIEQMHTEDKAKRAEILKENKKYLTL